MLCNCFSVVSLIEESGVMGSSFRAFFSACVVAMVLGCGQPKTEIPTNPAPMPPADAIKERGPAGDTANLPKQEPGKPKRGGFMAGKK
jgi:hypothetical protein